MAINRIVLLLMCCELHSVWSQTAIPASLRECYKNNAIVNPQLPLNLRIVVDIIQKLEKHSYSTADMRVTSSSLLHRFKFDGIEYQEGVRNTNVLPYSGTGTQRVKHSFIEELIPGDANALPVHVLSEVERCILHQTVSNAILKFNIDTENKWCSKVTHIEKLTGLPFGETWTCSRQQGVILTAYGTVTPGAVIGAVAASLQSQNVAVNQLIAILEESFSTTVKSSEYSDEEVDFVLPKSEMIHEQSMWYQSLMTSLTNVDNMWLATVAGDLAEMAVYQGPLLGPNMTLGATGYWNSTIRPTIYYLMSSTENFDATRAELLGSIDGMIIASNLQTWIQSFYSLRLSQVLDMYYSYEGVAFNTNVKACNRAQNFLHAVPKTILKEQTYAVAQLLAYRKSIASVSPKALERMVGYAVEKFYSYAESQLFPELPCYEQTNQPRVEALIVFDGAWSIQYTIDFLALLIQDLDVSMYGSKMGIIHGTSGDWTLNITNSPSRAFQALNNFPNISWPTELNYTRVLETIYAHLNETWESNQNDHRIGNLGQVVVLLIPLGHLSNDAKQSAMALLQQIKQQHPDVHFVYFTSRYNTNLFKPFILSDEDHLIRNSNIDAISQHLSRIPRTLRPSMPKDVNTSKNIISQLEDYASTSKSVTYRVHSLWKRNIKMILITMHTFGYGSLKVCSWTKLEANEQDHYCMELSGHNETTLSDNFKCPHGSPCPDTYIRVQNVTSLYRCAEIECRTPDQVRFIIRLKDVHYENSVSKTIKPLPLTLFLSYAFLLFT